MASYAAMGELSSTPTQTPTLGYATPKSDRKPAPAKLYWNAFGFWAVAAFGGVACLFGYALTAWSGFAAAGIIWLLIGGGLTFVAFILGSIYLGLAINSKCYGATGRRAAIAFLLPILNLPLAFGCMLAGSNLFDHYSRQLNLVVTNPSRVPIDSIDVLLDGGVEATFDSVKPGESKRLQTQCSGEGQLWLRVTQGGETWYLEVTSYVSFDGFTDGPKHYTVTLAKPATAPTTKPYYFR